MSPIPLIFFCSFLISSMFCVRTYMLIFWVGVDRTALSAVPPDVYAQRFLNFVKARTDYDEVI